jgi:hypothetical protein
MIKFSDYLEAAQKGGKYDDIDFTPTQAMRAAAERGLKMRQEAPKSKKGGLSNKQASEAGIGSGVQRASDIKNGEKLSPETVKRMHSFFSRHSAYKDKHKSDPNGRAHQSWLLWGGDAGQAWAAKIVGMMKKADEKKR